MGAVRLAQISAEPLELAAHLSAVADDKCGALNIFVGQVRDHDPDAAGEVVALDYSAHPDAAKILVDLAARAAGDTGALKIIHACDGPQPGTPQSRTGETQDH